MRMSCNGCRVLRKGCSDNCSIRPCLQWINSSESQANATLFLAKFYGRAGLINLINAGPQHLRPAIFRSLLYEACGRIVNPVYGSVGLLWSGSWQLCQNAVEAVLKGAPITQIVSDSGDDDGPPLKAYDIRHIPKEENSVGGSSEIHRVRTRCRFKRSAGKGKASRVWFGSVDDESSHESSLSHQSEAAESAGTEMEAEVVVNEEKVELELTLGFEPIVRADKSSTKKEDLIGDDGILKMELGLDYPA